MRVCCPVSVSTLSAVSPSQVMCRRPGRCMMPPAPICATCLAGGFVFRRIPRVGHASARVVDRQIQDVALRWHHHPPSPIVGDERHPVTGEIDRRSRAWRRRLTAPALRKHGSCRDADARAAVDDDGSSTRPARASRLIADRPCVPALARVAEASAHRRDSCRPLR